MIFFLLKFVCFWSQNSSVYVFVFGPKISIYVSLSVLNFMDMREIVHYRTKWPVPCSERASLGKYIRE